MARSEGHDWLNTSIAGLQVRTGGVTAMRVLGWEGILPLSVMAAVEAATTATQRAPTAFAATTPPALCAPLHDCGRTPPRPGPRQHSTSKVQGRVANIIRMVLRRAGCMEFSGNEDGFVVDSGESESLLLVACTIDQASAAQRELRRYRRALTTAGMFVRSHPERRNTLLVRLT